MDVNPDEISKRITGYSFPSSHSIISEDVFVEPLKNLKFVVVSKRLLGDTQDEFLVSLFSAPLP